MSIYFNNDRFYNRELHKIIDFINKEVILDEPSSPTVSLYLFNPQHIYKIIKNQLLFSTVTEKSSISIDQLVDNRDLVDRSRHKPQIINQDISRDSMELFNNAEFCRREEKLEKALELYQKAHDEFSKHHEESGQGYSLLCLGIVSSLLGKNDKSLLYLQQAHEIFDKLTDKTGMLNTLKWIARYHFYRGDFSKAIYYAKQSLAIACELTNIIYQIKLIDNISYYLIFCSEYEKAHTLCQFIHDLSKKIGYIRGQGKALYSISHIHALRENLNPTYYHNNQTIKNSGFIIPENNFSISALQIALNTCDEALSHFRRIGDKRMEARALSHIGFINISLSHFDNAQSFFEQSELLADHISDKWGKAMTLFGFALLRKNKNDSNGCRTLLVSCNTHFETIGAHYHQCEVLLYLSRIYRRESHYTIAEATLHKVNELNLNINNKRIKNNVLIERAHIKRRMELCDDARELYEHVHFNTMKSVNYDHIESILGIGKINYKIKNNSLAMNNFREALALAQSIGNLRQEGMAYLNIANLQFRMSQIDDAFKNFKKAEKIFSAGRMNHGLLKASYGIARIQKQRGDYSNASTILQRNVAEACQNNKKKDMLKNLIILAEIDFIYGKTEEAEQKYKNVITIAHECNEFIQKGTGHLGLTYVRMRQGKMTDALHETDHALKIFRERDDHFMESLVLLARGKIYSHLGKCEEANLLLSEALVFCQNSHFIFGEISCLIGIGDFHRNRGCFKFAHDFYLEAFHKAKQYDFKRIKARTMLRLGGCNYVLGRYELANEYLEKALVITKDLGDYSLEGKIQFEQGVFLFYYGELSPALNVLQQSLVLFRKSQNKIKEAKTLRILGNLEYALNRDLNFFAHDVAQKILDTTCDVCEKKRMLIRFAQNNFYHRKFKQAQHIIEESLDYFKKMDNRYEQAILLYHKGKNEMLTGHFKNSEESFNLSHKLFFELDIPGGMIKTKRGLAKLMLKKMAYTHARNYCLQSLYESEQIKNLNDQAKNHYLLAKIEMADANIELAFKEASKAEHLYERLGQRWNYNKCIALKGTLFMKNGNIEKAIECYEKTLLFLNQSPKSEDLFNVLCQYACAKMLTGKNEEALAIFNGLLTDTHYTANIKLMTKLHMKMGDYYRHIKKFDLSHALYEKGYTLAKQNTLKEDMLHFLIKQKILFNQSGFKNKEDFTHAIDTCTREMGLNKESTLFIMNQLAKII